MGLDDLITEVEAESPSGDPLDRLAAATLRHEELAHQADELLDHFVGKARDAGCSWTQIGDTLGVTKQAAQQRHHPEKSGVMAWLKGKAKSKLFTRFTPRARTAVEKAVEEAKGLQHDHVGTEHLLLGMLRDPESIASKVLARWKIDHDAVHAEVLQRIGTGPEKVTGHVPFSARSKKTLELALREALALGHNYIGTEHILLALMRAEGLGAEIAYDRGARYDDIRDDVIRLLTGLMTDQG
jgi:hypothetical protein